MQGFTPPRPLYGQRERDRSQSHASLHFDSSHVQRLCGTVKHDACCTLDYERWEELRVKLLGDITTSPCPETKRIAL